MILWNPLTKCDRIALILPEYMCQDYAIKLKVEYKLRHVFNGKDDPTAEVEWRFTFSKVVPRHVPIRLARAFKSGIWKHWVVLHDWRSSDNELNHDAVAAGMDGNVILIFVVLSYGLLGSLLFVFLAECGWKYSNYTKILRTV